MMTFNDGLARLLRRTACLAALTLGALPASADPLRVLAPAGIEAVVPAHTAGNMTLGIMRNVFETLTVVRDGVLLPSLATEWSASADGTVWTFTLREGVSFTDGTPFNADAVVASFTHALTSQKPIPAKGNLGSISGVRAVDARTVEFVSSAPFSGLPVWISHPVAAIVSPASLAQFGDDVASNIAAGTGPFKIDSFELPGKLVLSANAGYWGGAPAIEGIDFTFVNDDQTRIAALLSGEADVNYYISPMDAPRFNGASDFTVENVPSIRAYIIHLPMNLPELQDRRVREALNLIVDRQALIDYVFKGGAIAMDSAIGPSQIGYKKVADIPFDPARAAALFAEAGWSKNSAGVLEKDGKPFPTIRLQASNGRYPSDSAMAQALVGFFTEAGVPTQLNLDEFATFMADARAKAATEGWMTQMAWGFAAEGVAMLCQVYLPGNVFNFGAYGSEDLTRACADINSTFDMTQRTAKIEAAAEMVFNDYPAIFLVSPSYLAAARTSFTDIGFSPLEFHEYLNAKPAQ